MQKCPTYLPARKLDITFVSGQKTEANAALALKSFQKSLSTVMEKHFFKYFYSKICVYPYYTLLHILRLLFFSFKCTLPNRQKILKIKLQIFLVYWSFHVEFKFNNFSWIYFWPLLIFWESFFLGGGGNKKWVKALFHVKF